jgi:hypothetical protein
MTDEDLDDLDELVAEHDDDELVDGLAGLLAACADLRNARLALGLSLDDVIERCPCDARDIEWVDEGDVAAPAEALVYYAITVGMRVEFTVAPRVEDRER